MILTEAYWNLTRLTRAYYYERSDFERSSVTESRKILSS